MNGNPALTYFEIESPEWITLGRTVIKDSSK